MTHFSVELKFRATLMFSLVWSWKFLIRGSFFGRYQLLNQLFLTSDKSSTSTILLLEAVVMLVDPKLPWSCKIVGYLLQRNTYNLLREIILTGKVCFKSNWPCHFWYSSVGICFIMPWYIFYHVFTFSWEHNAISCRKVFWAWNHLVILLSSYCQQVLLNVGSWGFPDVIYFYANSLLETWGP